MERLLNKSFILLLVILGFYSCQTTKSIANDCLTEKIKFEFNLLNENGRDVITNQYIVYEFCIPDNETTWEEVISINPQLKKTSSKGRSNCGKDEVLVQGNTDSKAFKTMLCKIANLDYVKEVNQTFWE